jgi:hypothetical protein
MEEKTVKVEEIKEIEVKEVEITDEQWFSIGYASNEPCDICGHKFTRVEPRFLYATCREHALVPPVERANYGKKENS